MTEEHPYDESNRRYLNEVAEEFNDYDAAAATYSNLALSSFQGLQFQDTYLAGDEIRVLGVLNGSHYAAFTLKVEDLEISEVYADEAVYDDSFEG